MTASSGTETDKVLDIIRRAWKSAFGTNRVTYLSGPITTGRRFVDWYAQTGWRLGSDSKQYRAALRTAVTVPNEMDLQLTADFLRARDGRPVTEPASLSVRQWNQTDYIELWEQFIADHANRVVFMPDWQYSAGCAAEYWRAHAVGISTTSIEGRPIVIRDAVSALRLAISTIRSTQHPPALLLNSLTSFCTKLEEEVPRTTSVMGIAIRKDQSLDQLADQINVAQFVSFEPVKQFPRQAYSRILGKEPNARFRDLREAANLLLERSGEGSVNVRSFTPDSPLSREFIYGLKSIDEIVSAVERLSTEGLNTIINETVDVKDGGVSGVLLGDVLEFAPDDTPRAVEKAGIASLPLGWGLRLLTSVYGFEPDLAVPHNSRLEFSVHPKPRGWRHTHTLGWEIAEVDTLDLPPLIQWPNRFSRMIGDKVFGLLVAHHIGLSVPRTTVINRRVAPFTFGQPTGSSEIWFRTAPTEQIPGKFTTTYGWTDPFRVLVTEDPQQAAIASVISQANVIGKWSGASIVLRDGEVFSEGVRGRGDAFMLGAVPPTRLPQVVRSDLEAIHAHCAELGAVRFEWVHDGNKAWVVQLHRGSTASEQGILVQGEADRWFEFDVTRGLPALRDILSNLENGSGLILSGGVGLTSHIADVIRKAQVPARIASVREEETAT